MTEVFPVQVKVISQRGTCAWKHKVGDAWLIKDNLTPGGVCLAAFNSLASNVRVLRFGGVFPWSQEKYRDNDVVTVACPDPENPVVFELKRLR